MGNKLIEFCEKMYSEKNFMLSRDLEKYKDAQTISAVWLIKKIKQTLIPFKLESYLVMVHEDQVKRIGGKVEDKDSFYYDSLFESRMPEASLLVGYLRGFKRYEILYGETSDSLWLGLMLDAWSNACICSTYINRLDGVDCLIAKENLLMMVIDRKKEIE